MRPISAILEPDLSAETIVWRLLTEVLGYDRDFLYAAQWKSPAADADILGEDPHARLFVHLVPTGRVDDPAEVAKAFAQARELCAIWFLVTDGRRYVARAAPVGASLPEPFARFDLFEDDDDDLATTLTPLHVAQLRTTLRML